METKFTLSGVDWDELLATHERNVEALQEANRVAFVDAQAGIERILAEVSRLMDCCRQFEEKLRVFEQAMAALDEANASLKQEVGSLPDGYIHAVAHKLLAPFTSIRSFSEILSDNPELPLEQRSSFLAIAIKESERLTRLIQQIIDLSKLRSDRAEWHIEDVDVKAAAEDAMAATHTLFRDKIVRLDATLPDDLPAVRADRLRLSQTVQHLLTNAAKFTEAGSGRVALTAETVESMVRISVSDDGPGIAPERRNIIFAKFLDVDDTLADEPQGVGLGLALSKYIVEYLGGRIWVDSVPGEGACFSFTLPCRSAAPDARDTRR